MLQNFLKMRMVQTIIYGGLIFCLFISQSCSSRPMHVKNVAKSDINLVTDAHLQGINILMQKLLVKLYKRNPIELNKQPYTIDYRLAQLFSRNKQSVFSELHHLQSTEAIKLCFDDSFSGDRVFALMVGLKTMIERSYNNQEEFYMFDTLDQQKLYNSARNIEILVWRLSHKKNTEHKPYLLTNGVDGEIINISFERIFGKMISIQDMMARIVADRTNRTINKVVHAVASAAFLPVGM